MGVFDFLFGTPTQTNQLDPQSQRARDFLLDQMMQQYSAGPVNVPRYAAVAPEAMYSGTNSLLASLGLEGVSAPDLPTANVGGMDVYTSAPFQTQIEADYAEKYPGQYDYLRSFYMDPVTGEMGSRSGYVSPAATVSGGGGGGGGGGSSPGGGGGGSYTGPVSAFDLYEGPNQSGGAGYGIGGYTSFGDMFDGGGPGASGDSYERGPSRGSSGGFFSGLFGG